MNSIEDCIDLDRYPIGDPQSERCKALVERCRLEFSKCGLFELPGLVHAGALREIAAEIAPLLDSSAFTHSREHNIFFDDECRLAPASHPAFRRMNTVNRTICADQIAESMLIKLYEWTPLRVFLAGAIGESRLYTMSDPLARVNVMAYCEGESLNWHFDRAQFATTMLVQAPVAGGELEYAYGLKDDRSLDLDGIASLLEGGRSSVRSRILTPGTLNVFAGRHVAHRTTPVHGGTPRLIAVFSYFTEPGAAFSETEQIEFYGRSALAANINQAGSS